MIHHLFHHNSTAPYVCKILIQRLTVSNPSPGYLRRVVEAFRTGSYNNRQFSGRYGDLAATVNAILLDPEVRSDVLGLDPYHGKLREPLVKLLHFLRALRFQPSNGREQVRSGAWTATRHVLTCCVRIQVDFSSLDSKIGQEYARSPSVFSYFLPEYQPDGAIADAGLFSPEAMVGTAPFMIGFLNGMHSLVDRGLSSCDNGLGRRCATGNVNEGTLGFTPQGTTTAQVPTAFSAKARAVPVYLFTEMLRFECGIPHHIICDSHVCCDYAHFCCCDSRFVCHEDSGGNFPAAHGRAIKPYRQIRHFRRVRQRSITWRGMLW